MIFRGTVNIKCVTPPLHSLWRDKLVWSGRNGAFLTYVGTQGGEGGGGAGPNNQTTPSRSPRLSGGDLSACAGGGGGEGTRERVLVLLRLFARKGFCTCVGKENAPVLPPDRRALVKKKPKGNVFRAWKKQERKGWGGNPFES